MSDKPDTTPQLIYKVTLKSLWQEGEETGLLPPMPIDEADGYMHFSTADQVAETLRLHFKGQSDLMLLAVPTDAIAYQLKWEPSRGGALFPHLYAPLAVADVVSTNPITVDDQGHCDLPDLK